MDTKHYTLLKNGSLAVERDEWDADNEKLALGPDGSKMSDGTPLIVYTNGQYEDGCDYGFAKDGHWYLY